MADAPPTFDVSQVAGELSTALDQHRASVAPTLAAPATSPMFTQHADGTIVDRAGKVLVHGVVKPQTT